MILWMPNQLIPFAVPQGQDKSTHHNKCDAFHHRHTSMFVVKALHIIWQIFDFAILFSFIFPFTCHENTQEWVSHCFPCKDIILLISIKLTKR
jgi:hypothetical protein